MRNLLILSVCSFSSTFVWSQGQPAKELVLFDFENAADVKAFTPLQLPKAMEPPPQVEQSVENATSGKHSLKITFDGGKWPTVITTKVPDNWDEYHAFHADVTVNVDCVVGFQVLQENSKRGGDWDGAVSRWTKTAILRPGKHHISSDLHPNGWSAVKTKLENGKVLGKVVSLEIFVYSPAKGETIYVDNIRLSTAKLKPVPPEKVLFEVLGTKTFFQKSPPSPAGRGFRSKGDLSPLSPQGRGAFGTATNLKVNSVQELAKLLKDKWKKPGETTVDQEETEFKALYAELKKDHPKSVLAIFRDGEKGYDRDHPDKVFDGWKDAYWSSHGPDGMHEERATNFGKHSGQEIFMRHRSPLMQVDLSSIPKGAAILAAKFLVVRRNKEYGKDNHPFQPNMWVAEACNRPWVETEVNAFEYARGKFWHAVGGMSWSGADPDFLPIYLAHGQSGCKVNTWNFTHAVRYWTDGKHANHGFMLHGDSRDWIQAWYREAPNVKDRPALLVIYQPPAP